MLFSFKNAKKKWNETKLAFNIHFSMRFLVVIVVVFFNTSSSNNNNRKSHVLHERSRKHYQTRPRFYHFVEYNSHIWHWSSTSSSRYWHKSKWVYVCVDVAHRYLAPHARHFIFIFQWIPGIFTKYPKYWWCCKSMLNSYIYKDNIMVKNMTFSRMSQVEYM